MMEAVSTSETPINFYQTTRCNIPEDSHLQLKMNCKGCGRKRPKPNLKYYRVICLEGLRKIMKKFLELYLHSLKYLHGMAVKQMGNFAF
jgi:hypothetical protein